MCVEAAAALVTSQMKPMSAVYPKKVPKTASFAA
jgi:hypothetical protein